MRLPTSNTGFPSSLVNGFDLQQQVSGAAFDPSFTTAPSGFFFEPPQPATITTKASASKFRMRSSYHACIIVSMRRLLVLLALALAATPAAADGPAVRFGLTGALADQGAPSQTPFGPMLALGTRIGPILGEVDYAYLSFVDPETIDGGMHRLGLNVRADVYRDTNRQCLMGLACTKAFTLYAELGAAMRYGQWALDAYRREPANSDRQREAHIGFGLSIDNQLHPRRLGWQLGFRITAAPRDDLMLACRGESCTADGIDRSGEIDYSFLFEWTFLVGR
jgi:hypothetical protein